MTENKMLSDLRNHPVVFVVVSLLIVVVGVVFFDTILTAANDRYVVGMETDRYIKVTARDAAKLTPKLFIVYICKEREGKEEPYDVLKKVRAYADASVIYMPFIEEREAAKRLLVYLDSLSIEEGEM